MSIFWLSASFVIIILLSWKITAWVYGYAQTHSILDHPNQRSLHTVPTPRGGGLSITILVLGGSVLLWLSNQLSLDITLGVFVGGTLVAVIGWIDDKSNFSTLARGLFYLLASAWAVYWILGGDYFSTRDTVIVLLGSIIGIAWLTNLYNFMDGSDGIAAVQAIATGVMAAMLLSDANESGMALLSLIIVASSMGFLIWNWPPARIFMGDVGSCLLGFVFGALALASYINEILPISVWLILLSIFICDASLTLVKRFLNREQWFRAHRQHAYQRFIQLGNSHQKLNFHVLIINMLLLYPMAYLAYQSYELQWWATLSVYGLLTGIWLTIQIKYKNSLQNDS